MLLDMAKKMDAIPEDKKEKMMPKMLEKKKAMEDKLNANKDMWEKKGKDMADVAMDGEKCKKKKAMEDKLN